MPDLIDPPSESAPPVTFTRRAGFVGAILVFLISVGMILALFLPAMYRERIGWDSLATPETLYVFKLSLMLAFVAAIAGFLTGREGARCPTVNLAFLQGGIYCGLATFICLVVQILASLQTDSIHSRGYFTIRLIFLAIFTATGALVAGMAAIVVRDRREFGRARWIPQFTLQEIFIVFTIVSVIISALTCITTFRFR